ncbi:MAG: protein phosphatase 2C domain-containing protein [bacterium]
MSRDKEAAVGDCPPSIGSATDRGLNPARPKNEDALFVPSAVEDRLLVERGRLYAVADGMGGEAAGEVASRLGVDALSEHYYRRPWAGDPGRMLAQAMRAAHEAVAAAAEAPERKGMGATLTALVLHGDKAYIASVGDSRCYLLRDGQMSQITNDHTLVARLVSKGLMTPEQARNSPKRNIISRALGIARSEAESFELEPRAGDRFLLSSDGAHGVLEDEELRDILLRHPPDRAVLEIVEQVKKRGAPDNVTVIVVQAGEAARAADSLQPTAHGRETMPLTASAPRRPRRAGRRRALPLVLAGLVFLLVLAFAVWRYLERPAVDSGQPEADSLQLPADSLRQEEADSLQLPADSPERQEADSPGQGQTSTAPGATQDPTSLEPAAGSVSIGPGFQRQARDLLSPPEEDSGQPSADSLPLTAESGRTEADSSQPTADSLLPSADSPEDETKPDSARAPDKDTGTAEGGDGL